MFIGQPLRHGLDLQLFFAWFSAGEHGRKQLALLFQVVLKNGFAKELERLFGNLPGTRSGLQQGRQFIQCLEALNDPHMTVVEVAQRGLCVDG